MQVLEIQAAVLRNKGGPLRIESLELEGPRDDEVLVGIVATSICHTDIDFYDDWDGAAEPVVLGHEGAGVVERVGKRVKGVDAATTSCSPTSHAGVAVNAAVDTLPIASTSTKRTSASNALTVATRCNGAAFMGTSSVSLPSPPALW